MKIKLLAVFAAVAMVFAFNFAADAQMMSTDVVFLRVGYVPNYTVSFDSEMDDLEMKGYTGMGEYNLNMGTVWLGFGLEYQYVIDEADESGEDDANFQFLIPQVTAKFVTSAGFYIGAGLAGKYMMAYDFGGDDAEIDKKIDLWANGVIGFFMPISEGVYFDIMGRFGYNLTNNQFETITVNKTDYDLEPASAYDIAVYVGIGFRALDSGM